VPPEVHVEPMLESVLYLARRQFFTDRATQPKQSKLGVTKSQGPSVSVSISLSIERAASTTVNSTPCPTTNQQRSSRVKSSQRQLLAMASKLINSCIFIHAVGMGIVVWVGATQRDVMLSSVDSFYCSHADTQLFIQLQI